MFVVFCIGFVVNNLIVEVRRNLSIYVIFPKNAIVVFVNYSFAINFGCYTYGNSCGVYNCLLQKVITIFA